MKPRKGFLFISLPSEFKEKNKNGIYMPVISMEQVDMKTGQTVLNPEERKNITAEVIYAAEELDNYPVRQKYQSKIGGRRQPNMLMSISDLGYKMEVKVGDTIFFHYLENNVNDRSKWVYDKERNEYLLMIHQHRVLGYKSGDQLKAINGRVFIKPVEYPFGREQVNDLNIVTKLNDKVEDIGEVVAVSEMEGDYIDSPIKMGDMVLHSKFGRFMNDIEDEMLYVMNQEDVVARVSIDEENQQLGYTPLADWMECFEDKQAKKGLIHIPNKREAEEVIRSHQTMVIAEKNTITGRKVGTMGGAAEHYGRRLKKGMRLNNIPLRMQVSKIGPAVNELKWPNRIELYEKWLAMVVEREEEGIWFVKEQDVALIHS